VKNLDVDHNEPRFKNDKFEEDPSAKRLRMTYSGMAFSTLAALRSLFFHSEPFGGFAERGEESRRH
jgi:hypothetical protein